MPEEVRTVTECRAVVVSHLEGGVVLRLFCLREADHDGIHGFAQYDLERSKEPLMMFMWPVAGKEVQSA